MNTRTETKPDKVWESGRDAGQLERFHAKRGAVGALAIGAQAVGALALGALAIGTLAVGRLLIGRVVVGKGRMHRLTIDELNVKRLRVGELVITDTMETPANKPIETIARQHDSCGAACTPDG